MVCPRHSKRRGPHLLAVDLDGRARWRFDAQASPNAWLDYTPVVTGEYVCTVLSSGSALALLSQDGALAWRVDVGPAGKRLTPPATDGERLYVGARDGLHALDLAHGREAWTLATARRVVAAPVALGGVVYVTSHDHRLYALDAATGAELWRYEAARRHVRWRAVPVVGVSPFVTPAPQALALVADRGGTLTAVGRRLSAPLPVRPDPPVAHRSVWPAPGSLA